VAKRLSIEQMKQLAAHGARARMEELRAEIAAITQAFPEVGESGDATVGRRRRRRRGKLSAAGRAAISAAQKKRWAAIKRQRAKAPSAS
jgi:hypothetical protein